MTSVGELPVQGRGQSLFVVLMDRLESYRLTNQIYAERTDTDDLCTRATNAPHGLGGAVDDF